MEIPAKENPVHRHPRTNDVIALSIARLRAKYPAPAHNWKYGPSINPADMVLTESASYSKKKLKRLCEKHALEPTGGRRKMIKRLYLHWRASKFSTGDPYIGYGPGYESTRTPNCVCGFRKRADIIQEQKFKETQKEMVKEQKRRMEGLWNEAFERKNHRRFPRLLFPRLERSEAHKLKELGYVKWKKLYG